MPIPLTRDGVLPSRSIVVVQYHDSDGTWGFDVKLSGGKLNDLDFSGPGADTWLLMSGDQVKVIVQTEGQDEEVFMIRNDDGNVVTRRFVEGAPLAHQEPS